MVFLHYQPLEKINFADILGLANHVVIIPLITLNELDQHKNTHQNAQIRERARNRINALKRWNKEGQLSPSLSIEFLPQRPMIDFHAYGLNTQWNDDQLIASIIQFKKDHPNERVVLLTQDTTLNLRAPTFGIETIDIPDEYLLPQEDDPLVKENRKLQNELNRIKQTQPKLIVRLSDMNDDENYVSRKLQTPSSEPSPDKNKYLANLRESLSHPLRKDNFIKKQNAIEKACNAIDQQFSLIEENELTRYKDDLENYISKMSEYFDELELYKEQQCRTIALQFELRNTGTVPATDIDLMMHFPDGFDLYTEDDRPNEPQEPSKPLPPQTLMEKMANLHLSSPYIPSIVNMPDFGPPDPFSLRKTNSYELNYNMTNLKHGYLHNLKPLYLIFPSREGAKSFNCDYIITAANLPEPVNEQIHIIVEKE